MSNMNNYPPGAMPPAPPPPRQPQMSVKDWAITSMILFIPCVGLIMLLVWAFSTGNETKSNFAKGYLIAAIIWFIISIILSAIFSAAIFSMLGSMYYYY